MTQLITRIFLVAFTASLAQPLGLAQEEPAKKQQEEPEETQEVVPRIAEIRVEPAEITLDIDETVEVVATPVDADGNEVEAQLLWFSRGRRVASVDRDGVIKALSAGNATILVRERRRRVGQNQEGRSNVGPRAGASIRVTVRKPALESMSIDEPTGGLYTGTTIALTASAVDVRGDARENVECSWTSSDPAVATVDAFGGLTVHKAGSITVTAEAEGKSATAALVCESNPIEELEVTLDVDAPRTGDVVHIFANGRDANGAETSGVPIELAMFAEPDDDLGPAATGQLERVEGDLGHWRFVAGATGKYSFVATSGNAVARAALRATKRDVQGKFELVGHGRVDDTHTSDLWVWEASDGRDYAVTGTWGAGGDAHFWDVTDPANIERVATVTIDARTVNDVKVSPDGRMCVLSREGASNRKNGIVLVDVTDPRNPEIRTSFDDELTGGVHNVFITEQHVYALSAGQRYHAIDISDPGAPRKVGSYEVDATNPSIHDVWVEDGLAFSSNWSNGVHIVDVGNGMAGGSPTNPVKVSSYAYPSGWNHAAFPFRQKDSGRFYVAAGDEAFPHGLNIKGKPTYPRGWIHFLDFTDMESPSEVARYQVPEAGTHNLWIENEVMYVAYYNAGLRAVDVSGELMGDLYDQGREIAWFLPDDPEGHIANAPMAWGPQPHKGHIFFSDWNSGLWAVKLVR